MPERLRWFNGTRITTGSLRNAAKQMLQWKYSDDVGWGFLLAETRQDSIDGRFIERLTLREDIVDPSGRPLHYERVLFHQTRFSLQTQFPHLELRNAPRSISTFLNQLGRAFDFSVSIAPVEFDLLRLIGSLDKKFEKVKIFRMTVSDITLSKGVEAKCAVAGEGDVREHVRAITSRRKFRVSSIGASFSMNETELRVGVSSDGRIVVATELSEDARRGFRQIVKEAASE